MQTRTPTWLDARLFRVAAWLACVAMCFGALAPAVSQAMASSLADVCVAGDLADPSPAAPSDPAPARHEHHGPACPFCLTHGASSAAPPPVAVAPPASPAARGIGPRCASVASPAHAGWNLAAPRGPPRDRT